MGKLGLCVVLVTISSVWCGEQIPKYHYPRNPVKYPVNYCEKIKNNEEFDFIVMGGGVAGSVVARRLAEIKENRVLLIEAGDDPPAISDIPGNAVKLGLDLRWKFHTVEDEHNCRGIIGNTCKLVPGKVLGGSSVINYMMYVRGNSDDYDEWRKMGNSGWGYKEVLPYFKKLENYIAQPIAPPDTGPFISKTFYEDSLKGKGYQSINISPKSLKVPAVSSHYHSIGGPFSGAAFPIDPLTHPARLAIFEAFQAFGVEKNYDCNGEYQMGICNLPGMVDVFGYRHNAAKAYLLNIPDNLKVCKNAIVQKVKIDATKRPKVVKSVEFVYYPSKLNLIGRTLHAKARKEYIISGGPLNTPGILERSGIGIAKILRAAGVEPIHELKVGENFQDQYINLGSTFVINYGSKTETNPNTIELTSMTAFVNVTNPLSSSPDIQFIFKTYDPAVALGLSFKPDITIQFDATVAGNRSILFFGNIILRQTEHGSVHIKQSADPRISPNIIPNQLTTRRDIELTVKATRMAREIMAHEALEPFKPEPFVIDECKIYPFNSEDEIMCGARMMASTLYHQCGTATMGPASDPNSVVTPQLRVKGMKNLRVVDSSIMPIVSRGNTEVPTLMIAEMGADLIKSSWGQKKK